MLGHILPKQSASTRVLSVILYVMRIEIAGAGFRSLTEAINTTTTRRAHDDADGRSFAKFG